ncbi:MAG: SPFH domain-containing protein [Campylobacterota bacterium]|nr:SPFH domain-containing protein [Campylobacterota bacterium]
MGLFDFIFGEFIDVIDWTDDTQNTMVYRFPRYGNEIKYGAKLIVRESQQAVFVNEGEIADILGPGIYKLETKNLPVLTKLQHWDHGFNSPFKAEVYFINTKRFINLKWGTRNPVMLRDPEFGMVRLRAFGTYSIRVTDPGKFMREVVGTDSIFSTQEISEQLTNIIVSKFASVMGDQKIAALDLAKNYESLGTFITAKISPFFEEYGLSLTHIFVENISLPEEVEKVLDKRTSREITGDLNKHIKYETGNALGNENGGGASDMVGMGAGLAMASKMANSLNDTSTPPPISLTEEHYFVAIEGKAHGPYDMKRIKAFIEDGTILGDTQVWTEGMPQWQRAITVLNSYFSVTPPDL